MNAVIIDSGGGNLGSVQYALQRLGTTATISTDWSVISAADKVLLPGVGASGPVMQRLSQLELANRIPKLKQPVLGICLGMQLLFSGSEEGEDQCLNIIPGRVSKFPPAPGLRLPHMGWNQIQTQHHALFNQIDKTAWFYFVHGYYAPVGPWTLATGSLSCDFSAVVTHNNFYGAQFHPERSAAAGAQLLKNFLEL